MAEEFVQSLARGLQVIERNARLQAQLIEDLLDVARIDKGKISLKPQAVSLQDIVQSAVDIATPKMQAGDF